MSREFARAAQAIELLLRARREGAINWREHPELTADVEKFLSIVPYLEGMNPAIAKGEQT